MRAAFESLKPWGTCVVVGLPPMGMDIGINPWLLLTGRKLTGSYFGGYKPIQGILKLIEQHLAGQLNLDAFITNKIQLKDINKGFDDLKQGKTLRTVLML